MDNQAGRTKEREGIAFANVDKHRCSSWATHRSSSFASRSATLSSIRKMSCSSREKERAIVLERETKGQPSLFRQT